MTSGVESLGVAAVAASSLTIVLITATLSRSRRRTCVITLAVALILLASSWLVGNSAVVPVLMRVTAALFLGLLALSSDGHKRRERLTWSWGVALALGLFIAVGTIPHGLAATLLGYGIGLLVLTVVMVSVTLMDPEELRRGLSFALAALLGASLLLGIAIPGSAIEGERLRGIFENANTLGFVAFLGIATVLYTAHSKGFRVLVYVLCGLCLVWSGSRASTLAVLIVCVGWLFTHRFVVGLFAATIGALFLERAFVAVSQASPALERLFRDTNSRSSSVEYALIDWYSSPIFGVGIGQESSIIASSQLRALAQGGTLGFLAILLLCLFILIVSLRANRDAAWFAIAAVTHSFFEGWLLSPIAPLLLAFTVTWLLLLDGRALRKRKRDITLDTMVPEINARDRFWKAG